MFFRQGVMADQEEPETIVVVDDGTNYGQGIDVITEFNAPMSPDTLQKITSGVTEQNSMANTNVAPSSTRSFMVSTIISLTYHQILTKKETICQIEV